MHDIHANEKAFVGYKWFLNKRTNKNIIGLISHKTRIPN